MPQSAGKREQEKAGTQCSHHRTTCPRELSQICSDLHGSVTGMSDPMSDEDVAYDLETLRTAVRDWDHNESPYDNAQLALVKATLAEYEGDAK